MTTCFAFTIGQLQKNMCGLGHEEGKDKETLVNHQKKKTIRKGGKNNKGKKCKARRT